VKYYYDKADFAGMKQELSTIDWEEKLSIQDENKQWKFFKDTVLYVFKISTHRNVSQEQLSGHFFPEDYNIPYRKSFHLHLTTANQEREVHGQYVHELVYSHVDRGNSLLLVAIIRQSDSPTVR
jgi:hypothetical protein